MPRLHLVFGPPAAGKTTDTRDLAAGIGAVLLDSDEVAEKLVRAGLMLAGMNPDDRDSPAYKAAFRDAVHESPLRSRVLAPRPPAGGHRRLLHERAW